jgi:cobaltochelatase CobN
VPAKLDATGRRDPLRVTGLFRDVFRVRNALFDEATRAVAALDEDEGQSLAAARRAAGGSVDGRLPRLRRGAGAYVVGLAAKIATCAWENRPARRTLARAPRTLRPRRDGIALPEPSRRGAAADAFVTPRHGEQDELDADAFASTRAASPPPAELG